MIDAAAVRRGDELDDLAGMERPVDRVERGGIGRPMLGDRVRHVAQRRADAVDAPELARLERVVGDRLGADAVGALAVDHPPIDEPRKRVVEGRELLERETIVGVIGVQEVEGVFEVDVVSVTPIGRVEGLDVHLDNHSTTVDRLRASRYITQVTDLPTHTG